MKTWIDRFDVGVDEMACGSMLATPCQSDSTVYDFPTLLFHSDHSEGEVITSNKSLRR
jgi:hypothetical protein